MAPMEISFGGFQLKLFLELPTLCAYFDEKQYELKSNRDMYERYNIEIQFKTRAIISLPSCTHIIILDHPTFSIPLRTLTNINVITHTQTRKQTGNYESLVDYVRHNESFVVNASSTTSSSSISLQSVYDSDDDATIINSSDSSSSKSSEKIVKNRSNMTDNGSILYHHYKKNISHSNDMHHSLHNNSGNSGNISSLESPWR